MRNSIGENFSQKEHTEKTINLSEKQKEFLNKALSLIDESPEIGASVKNNFDENLNNIIKNPENFQKLLDTIDANMHAKIEEISLQVKSGEIYAEEWKSAAKDIIISATRTKLDAIQREQEISEGIE